METALDNLSEGTTFKSISSKSDIYDQVDRFYFVDYLNNRQSTDSNLSQSKDIVDYELAQLNCQSKADIIARIKELQTKCTLVSRRISDNILANSQAYSQELQRVSDFKLLLEDSYQICSIARRSLHMNETIFTKPTLQLIKKQVRKTHLINLFKSIQEVKILKRTNVKIKELIDKEEYSVAISHCFECEKSLKIYEHYKCVKDLKKHIKDYFYQIERQLDSNVARVCNQYDEEAYVKIVSSFQLLDKMESFIGRF